MLGVAVHLMHYSRLFEFVTIQEQDGHDRIQNCLNNGADKESHSKRKPHFKPLEKKTPLREMLSGNNK